MVAPISNNISTGISPIVSNHYSNVNHATSNRQDLSTTSNDYTREMSANIASQTAVASGAQKGEIQYTYARTEKAFKEDHENDELPNKNNKKKQQKSDKSLKTLLHYIIF